MPDAPAPTTRERLGQRLERPRLLGADDAAAELRAGQGALHGAGGEDHEPRAVLGAVEVAADLDVALVGHGAVTLDDVDRVLLHQPGHAAGQRLDDLLAALADGGEVDGRLADRDAERGGLADVTEDVGDAQDRLRGDAGVVQAAPADLVGLDHRGLHPELCGADRGDVAAGTRADDDAVVGAFGHRRSSLSTRSRASDGHGLRHGAAEVGRPIPVERRVGVARAPDAHDLELGLQEDRAVRR